MFRANLKKMFDDADQDGSGLLEFREIKELVRNLI